MRNKLYLLIVIFLFLGLYVDIKMEPEENAWCFNGYLQRTLNVQVIVPFLPTRETFLFGVGNKHFEGYQDIYQYYDSKTGMYLGYTQYNGGCSLEKVDGYYGTFTHYIDLRPGAKVEGLGQIVVHNYQETETKEEWLKYHTQK